MGLENHPRLNFKYILQLKNICTVNMPSAELTLNLDFNTKLSRGRLV